MTTRFLDSRYPWLRPLAKASMSRLQRTPDPRHRWLPVVVFIVAATWLNAQESTSPISPSGAGSKRSDEAGPGNNSESSKATGGRIVGHLAGGRWREGSKLVDMPGQFKISGERAVFVSADRKSQFACLENLNSERIARMVRESPDLEWKVQGTITEHRNENYVLITHAMIENRTARPSRTNGDR